MQGQPTFPAFTKVRLYLDGIVIKQSSDTLQIINCDSGITRRADSSGYFNIFHQGLNSCEELHIKHKDRFMKVWIDEYIKLRDVTFIEKIDSLPFKQGSYYFTNRFSGERLLEKKLFEAFLLDTLNSSFMIDDVSYFLYKINMTDHTNIRVYSCLIFDCNYLFKEMSEPFYDNFQNIDLYLKKLPFENVAVKLDFKSYKYPAYLFIRVKETDMIRAKEYGFEKVGP